MGGLTSTGGQTFHYEGYGQVCMDGKWICIFDGGNLGGIAI